MNFDIVHNLDLLSVGIVVAATMILGFVVFYNNTKSTTNRSFLLFTIMTTLWGTLNYVNYQIANPTLAFWTLRVSIFFAVWHAFSFLQLFFVFPNETVEYPKSYKWALIPLVTASAILTLTPLVFSHVEELNNGRIVKVVNGPAIAFFTSTIVALVIGGVSILIKKIRCAKDEERRQLITMFLGVILTFTLILVFNFVFPAFLQDSRFTPLGALFIFPFIIFTSYAIVKHKVLNVKIVSSEILVFVLAITTFLEVVFSPDLQIIVLRSSQFLLVLIFGIWLVKSVLKEIRQREQLQILTKKLEEANVQLKQLDQARADFLTLTSHQLRTPPATIKWYLAAIRSGDYGIVPQEIAEQIAKTEVTNNALISLIDDLLNASRIERGKLEFLFEPVKLDELTKFTVEQLQPQAHLKGLELRFEASPTSVPEVVADKEKIRQVVNNFIDNAIKYSPKGSIVARMKVDSKFVSVEVQDGGKGIDKDVIASLFHKYSRGKDSVTHATGIGIGLYVAKIVVENHKGEIGALSDGVGKGSIFYFRIPIKNDLPHIKMMDLVEEQKSET